MKTTTILLGLIIAALMVVQPVGAQENPTEQIKKESTKVINRNIDKLFNRKKKKEEAAQEQQQQEQQQEQPQQEVGETGDPQQAGAASVAELADERDRNLVAILKALKSTRSGAGQVIADYEAGAMRTI